MPPPLLKRHCYKRNDSRDSDDTQQFPLTPPRGHPQCDFDAISTTRAPDQGNFESIFRLSGNCWTILIFILRGERFCVGFWEGMIEDGHVRQLLERLAEIERESVVARRTGTRNRREGLKLSLSMYRTRALRTLRDAFVRDHPAVEVDDRGYVPSAADNLVPGVRLEDFEADLRAGDGNELEHKFRAIHSSAALAVNVFGPFRARTSELALLDMESFAELEFEAKCPHGVSSRSPNLDVLLTGPGGTIGIESKLTEHLSRHRAVFSPRYREKIRDERRKSAWFEEMLRLEEDPQRYAWLDAAQLVKHAFGLAYTFFDDPLTLLYLYWEPRHAERFPPFAEHRCEVESFSARVAGSRPSFRAMSYPELWASWSGGPRSWLTAHLDALRARYEVEL